MSRSTEQRPPQVTLAAAIVIAASVMVLMSAWGRVSGLRSLETRESVEEFLSGAPGSEMGLGREDVLAILQVSSVVAAVCAVTTAILGWYVLKRDKTARLALLVAAVPLFFTGLVIGGFASSFVAAATVMLWMEPAREWFTTGRWTPPPPRQAPEREQPTRDDPLTPPWLGPTGGSTSTGQSSPPPFPTPYAEPGGPQSSTRTLAPGQPDPRTAQAVGHAAGQRRPGAVVAAFVLTVVSSLLVGLFAVLAMLVVSLAPEMVMEEFERQASGDVADLTLAQIRTSTFFTGAVCVLASAAALVFAGFAMARRPWARRGWLVAAAASAGACLFVVIASPAAVSGLAVLMPGAAAIATVVFLRRAEVRRWFESAPRS